MFNIDTKTVVIDTREDAKKAVDIIVEGNYLEEQAMKEWPLVIAKSVGNYSSVAVVRRDSSDNIVEEYERLETPEAEIDVSDIKIAFTSERTKAYFDKHIEWHMNPSSEEIDLDEEIAENLEQIFDHAVESRIPVKFLKREGKLPIQLGNMTIKADFSSTFKDVVILNKDNEIIYRIHDYMSTSIEVLTSIVNEMVTHQNQPRNEKELAVVIGALGHLGATSGVITIVTKAKEEDFADSVFKSLSVHTKNEVITVLMQLKLDTDWGVMADNLISEWTEQGIWTEAA